MKERERLEKYPEPVGGWGVFGGEPLTMLTMLAWFPDKADADNFRIASGKALLITRVFVLTVVWDSNKPHDDDALESALYRHAHEL